jgi:hypothetical protein
MFSAVEEIVRLCFVILCPDYLTLFVSMATQIILQEEQQRGCY